MQTKTDAFHITVLDRDCYCACCREFYETPEDSMGVFGHYYHLPIVSLRDAIFTAARGQVAGFRFDEVFADVGMVHIGMERGHRCALLPLASCLGELQLTQDLIDSSSSGSVM